MFTLENVKYRLKTSLCDKADNSHKFKVLSFDAAVAGFVGYNKKIAYVILLSTGALKEKRVEMHCGISTSF